MSEPSSTEKLTTWAAGSESRLVQFIRTTLGPLLLILFTPPAAIIFWIVCTFEPFNGSLSPLLTAAGWRAVAAHWPWPSLSAAAIVLVFVVVQVILLQWLPGKIFEGPITPTGRPPALQAQWSPRLVRHPRAFLRLLLWPAPLQGRHRLGPFRRDPRHARALRPDLLPLPVFQGPLLAHFARTAASPATSSGTTTGASSCTPRSLASI